MKLLTILYLYAQGNKITSGVDAYAPDSPKEIGNHVYTWSWQTTLEKFTINNANKDCEKMLHQSVNLILSHLEKFIVSLGDG